VFSELAKDPKLERAIRAGFDNALLSAEVLALQKDGPKEDSEMGLDALRIIEDFRRITFGERN
jgi:hypothetical protein